MNGLLVGSRQTYRKGFSPVAALVLAMSILILLAGSATGTEPPVRSSDQMNKSAAFDSAAVVNGLIIDSIEIDNRNVFNTSERPYNNILFRTANKLHIVTRKHVISRELLFKPGDRFSAELAEETARNLRLKYWLYDAWIETVRLDNGHLLVRVKTIDEWSLRTWFKVHRDANLTDYQFALEETNALGNNQYLSFYYFVPARDHSYPQLSFRDIRFLGRPLTMGLLYNDDPLGRVREILLGKPFYNLNQSFSYQLMYTSQGGRRDIHNDTETVASSQRKGDLDQLDLEYRWGTYTRKLGVSAGYEYRYERTFNKVVVDSTRGPIYFPDDSLYHQVSLGVYAENINYIKTKRISGFGIVEDVQTGQHLGVSFGRAFSPGFTNSVFDQAAFQATFGYRSGPHLLLLSYGRTFWYRAGTTVRRTSDLSCKYFNNGLSFFTLAARVAYSSDRRLHAVQEIVLDGESGIRGYDRYFKTGDRFAVLNVEGRFFPGLELLNVLFGAVLFGDFGQAWKPPDIVRLDRLHWSLGAGLRISLEKVSKNELIRLDLSRTELNKWEYSIGTGQYF